MDHSPEVIAQIRGLFAKISSRLDPLKVLGEQVKYHVAFQLPEETTTIRGLVLEIWGPEAGEGGVDGSRA